MCENDTISRISALEDEVEELRKAIKIIKPWFDGLEEKLLELIELHKRMY